MSIKTISLSLVYANGSVVTDYTNLQFAFFATPLPFNFGAPEVTGNGVNITGGLFEITLHTALNVGDTGFLILTNTNGSSAQSPSAIVFAGPVLINNGDRMSTLARNAYSFDSVAEFNSFGGPVVYGEGPLWIAGQQYWSNGTTYTEVGGGSSNSAKNKIAIMGNSIVLLGAGIFQGSNTFWAANTAKILTNTVIPNIIDLSGGYLKTVKLTCTQAGTTGAMEPIWSEGVGDIINDGTVQWTVSVDTAAPKWSTGWWHLAQQLSGQRLDEVFICGLSGKLSSDIFAYYDRMMSTNPDLVYLSFMFENNVGNSPTLSSIQTAFDEYETKARAVISAGKKLYLQTVQGNASIDSTSAFAGYVSSTETKCYNWLNEKIRWLAKDLGCRLIDVALLYPDPNPVTSSTNAPVWPENTVTYLSEAGAGQALKKTDGVHPYTSAHWILANVIAEVIIADFPDVARFTGAGSTYSLSLNPNQFGTSGTAGSGTITGTVPNLCTLNASGTGGAATTSLVSRGLNAVSNWLQAVYTATAATTLSLFGSGAGISVASNPSFAVGTPVQAFFETKVLANPTLMTNVVGQLFFNNGAPFSTSLTGDLASTSAQDLGQFIKSDTVFIQKTPPIKVPTGTTHFNFYMQIKARGACNVTAQFGRQSLNLVNIPVIS